MTIKFLKAYVLRISFFVFLGQINGIQASTIYEEIWKSDNNRCTVTYVDSEGQPVKPNTHIVLNEQGAAEKDTNQDLATHPLFKSVDESVFAQPTYTAFIKIETTN